MTTANNNGPRVEPKEVGLPAIKNFLNGEGVKKRFEEILGKRASGFIMSVLQAASNSKALAECDVQSIYNAAATAAILDLPLNNNLQFAYIIPYKENGKPVAQFQLGWRGLVQLAQRSGKFQTINVTDVRLGELVSRNRLSGECTFNWEQDDVKRGELPIIGFVSFFQLTNGFIKSIYKTVAELKAHGQKYSKTFNRSDSKWHTDFAAMCAKTVLKENLSKFAPLSVEMALGIQADQTVIKEPPGIDEGQFVYPDNPDENQNQNDELGDEEAERIKKEAEAKQAEEALAEELKNKGGKK